MNIQIELPIKVSTNKIYAGTHWTTRTKHKELFYYELLKQKKNLSKAQNYPLELTFIFRFKSKPLDSSNCSYMAKMIEDCIVKLGVIESDTIKFVKSVKYISEQDKNLQKDMVSIYIE
jgi:chromosome condensin MukBEF complex kleisin-like MukF subunit